MSEKPYSMILGPIWSKIVFWKKKVAKFAQKYWKFQIFWISQIHKMAGSDRNWPIIISKHRLCPKVIPKFFLCPKPKNSWKYSKKLTPPPKKGPFFWVGGKFIKCRFRQLWRSMFEKKTSQNKWFLELMPGAPRFFVVQKNLIFQEIKKFSVNFSLFFFEKKMLYFFEILTTHLLTYLPVFGTSQHSLLFIFRVSWRKILISSIFKNNLPRAHKFLNFQIW